MPFSSFLGKACNARVLKMRGIVSRRRSGSHDRLFLLRVSERAGKKTTKKRVDEETEIEMPKIGRRSLCTVDYVIVNAKAGKSRPGTRHLSQSCRDYWYLSGSYEP
jgi:hypothetical protein